MKNRVKEFWVWYWGDENGIINSYPDATNTIGISFEDFDDMKKYSADHAYLFQNNYEGYWSSYTKIEI